MEKPLVDNRFLLKKIPGKGGWTYANIPQILPDKKTPFGWVKVKGTIEGYEIKNYHLMPFGNGQLFLPVKSEIRKKIKKKEGDYVHVILYPGNDPFEIPEEMTLCLKDEPKAQTFFNSLGEGEQHHFIEWIYSAKTEKTKAERMAKTINKLVQKKKFTDG